MQIERIGLIFPDLAQISEIKSWLNAHAPGVQVSSFTNLPQAVPAISKVPCDLLLVADRFPEANGSILFAGLRKLCPNAQIIMLAIDVAPIAELSNKAQKNINLVYFPQPWDKQSLLAHIEASIGKETPTFTTALVLENKEYEKISRLLEDLQQNLSAPSIYLVTDLGQVLDYKGSELAQIGEISSLLGGSFAALQQLGATLGEDGLASNLIHRQGNTEDLYAFSVGNDALLVLHFAAGATAPRIGTVAFYARQIVTELSGILAESRGNPTKPFAPEGMESTLKEELDQLFTNAETDPASTARTDRLFTFTQALKKGLVSKSLINRLGSKDLFDQDEPAEGETK